MSIASKGNYPPFCGVVRIRVKDGDGFPSKGLMSFEVITIIARAERFEISRIRKITDIFRFIGISGTGVELLYRNNFKLYS